MTDHAGYSRYVISEQEKDKFMEYCKQCLYEDQALGDNPDLWMDYYLSHIKTTTVKVIPDGDIVFSEWKDGKCKASFVPTGESLPLDAWISEDPEIATVTPEGVIKGRSCGYANIFCTFGGNTIYFGKTVEITPDRVGVESVYEDDQLPDMIWDLSGRPVYGELNAQQPGIYIVRKNGKTSKQAVGRR